MRTTPVRANALLFALALAAGAAEDAFFVNPSRVDAGKAFALEVLSYRYNCGTRFSDLSFSRDGARIAVRFVARENPAALCPAIEKPWGPKFDMPALAAGRYRVFATPLLPCQVGTPACEIPEREEDAGILTVGSQANADWFIQPSTVAPSRAFNLRILNDRYGNCQTSFTHVSHTVLDGKITANFVIVTDPSVICIVDIHPHGPSFEVGALKAGRYPVLVIETPGCIYDKPPCPWLPPAMVARPVDTLVVASGTTAAAPAPRPAKRGRAGLARGNLSVTLPPGWKESAVPGSADIVDLQGRIKVLPIPALK